MSSPVSAGSLLLEQLLLPRVPVDRGGQRGAEALLVGAALVGVDGCWRTCRPTRCSWSSTDIATSSWCWSPAAWKETTFLWIGSLLRFRCATKSSRPPGVAERLLLDLGHVALGVGLPLLGRVPVALVRAARWSAPCSGTPSPAAAGRSSRCCNVVVSKMVSSAQKVIVVPLALVASPLRSCSGTECE